MEQKIKPELRKARLPAGETLWVKVEGDFARIDNIPISTNEYGYRDLIRLTIAADGKYEIEERVEWGGYTLKASNDDGTVKEFLEALEKIAITERIDEDHVVVAAKREDWIPILKRAATISSGKGVNLSKEGKR